MKRMLGIGCDDINFEETNGMKQKVGMRVVIGVFTCILILIGGIAWKVFLAPAADAPVKATAETRKNMEDGNQGVRPDSANSGGAQTPDSQNKPNLQFSP